MGIPRGGLIAMKLFVRCSTAFMVLLAGCGGDDGGANLQVAGGGADPIAAEIAESAKKPVDPDAKGFEKTAGGGGKRNTARDPGVTSGGGESTAVLD